MIAATRRGEHVLFFSDVVIRVYENVRKICTRSKREISYFNAKYRIEEIGGASCHNKM